MKILLKETEVEKLTEEWLDADEDVDWANMMNKAQLKKVAEWGGEPCPIGGIVLSVEGDNHRILRRECNHCWQALLKELE